MTTKTSPANVIAGLSLMLVLAIVAWWITKQVYALKLPWGIPSTALEYPLWAALVGLVGNGLLKAFRLHEQVRAGFRAELFLKVGLILLGASISFATLTGSLLGAIAQGVIMIVAVFFFCWWLGGKFGLEDKLRAVMATAIAVCGVSAAVAAAGSVAAKKEQVTYVTALVIMVALPMMVLAPLIASFLNVPQAVAGAWFGGNIDTTAAVVAAGTLYGDTAQTTAVIVKNAQNALIGLVTFLLALYFTTVVERQPGQRPSLGMIWERFPKFVLGFLLASVLFTFGVIDGSRGTAIDALKSWSFTLAFVGMGLDFSVSELRRLGWRPLTVFLIATLFNTTLAFVLAWIFFGGIF